MTLLTGFIGLRNDLIKLLVHAGSTNFKVMDSCCVTNCILTANLPERLEGLQKVTSKDGIHFSHDRYKNLSTRVLNCIESMLGNTKKENNNKKTYFWRGF
jgi:lysophospholipase L1-like esterase